MFTTHSRAKPKAMLDLFHCHFKQISADCHITFEMHIFFKKKQKIVIITTNCLQSKLCSTPARSLQAYLDYIWNKVISGRKTDVQSLGVHLDIEY